MAIRFAMHFLFLLFNLACLIFPPFVFSKEISDPIYLKMPNWAEMQVQKDLSNVGAISREKIDQFFNEYATHLCLAKFSIENNILKYELSLPPELMVLMGRLNQIKFSLERICSIIRMPDTVFLVSLLDGLSYEAESLLEEVPVFVMSKLHDSKKPLILFPDFDALTERYQVASQIDIVKLESPWNKKTAKLIWRGSSAQCTKDGFHVPIREDSLDQFSRITLCELSKKHPDLIDAGFTLLAQGGEHIPYLQTLKSSWVPYTEQFNFKYHIHIDGNTTAYSASGWKFFIGSLIFKPDSPWIQWYFGGLIPWVHYIPVRRDLQDLVELLHWAKSNDQKARKIAKNAQRFARNEIVMSKNLMYFYYVISEYSKLIR